jgi:hypothetical protein
LLLQNVHRNAGQRSEAGQTRLSKRCGNSSIGRRERRNEQKKTKETKSEDGRVEQEVTEETERHKRLNDFAPRPLFGERRLVLRQARD